jgi:AraC family transcriptional regulator
MKYFLVIIILVLFIGCGGDTSQKKTESQSDTDTVSTLGELQLKPEIVEKPAFAVEGMKYHGNNLQGEIGELWNKFLPRMVEIENPVRDGVAYGIMKNYEPPDTTAGEDQMGAFDYLACIEVTDKGKVPDSMEYWEIPEQKYAVFTFPFSKLIETYNYALRVWLPKSGYIYGDGPEFEYYPPNFGSTEDSEMKYYIPVKEK